MTPADASNELDVQNEWEENTHKHTNTLLLLLSSHMLFVVVSNISTTVGGPFFFFLFVIPFILDVRLRFVMFGGSVWRLILVYSLTVGFSPTLYC